jgi:PAS domain S-box-containing protein
MEADQRTSAGEFPGTADKEYRRLFEESSVPMFVYARDNYSFLAVNSAALKQYGYTEDEFLRLTVMDIRPPEERERFLQVQRENRKDFNDVGRWRHQRKNGESFIVHIYTHRTSYKGIDAWMVSAVDVSHHAQLEGENYLKSLVKEDVLQMKSLLESITDGFFALDKGGKITYVNKEFEQLTVYHQEELIGQNIFEMFPALSDHALARHYNKALQEKVTQHFEDYFQPFNTWLAVNVFPSEEGVSFYFHDITRERQIQEKLQKEEAHLRSIINNAKDIIWSVDHNYKLITANSAFWDHLTKLTGKSPEQIREDDMEQDQVLMWKEFYARAFDGETFKEEIITKLPEEEQRREVTFHPVHDKEGNVIGVSCFSRLLG